MLRLGARDRTKVTVTVNGKTRVGHAEPRLLLCDFLRHEIGLYGTHVGCEHGVCGACTVLMNGESVRACLVLAVQADGAELLTVEGLSPDGELHAIQEAFLEEHGMQCGFCTPGFLLTTYELLENTPDPSDEEIMDALGGQLCRCTGYQPILAAVKLAATRLREANTAGAA